MKLFFRQFIFTLLLGLLIVSGVAFGGAVFAQESDVFGIDDAGFGVLEQGSGGGLKDTINTVMQWAFGFLGIVAVLILLYGGYTWMTAGGDADKVEKAKLIIRNAIIGLIIILTSYMIVSMIFNTFYGEDGPIVESCDPGETRACQRSGCTGSQQCLATEVWGGCVIDGLICVPEPTANNVNLLHFSDPAISWKSPVSYNKTIGIPNSDTLKVAAGAGSSQGSYTTLGLLALADKEAATNAVGNFDNLVTDQTCTPDGLNCTIEETFAGWNTSDYIIGSKYAVKAVGSWGESTAVKKDESVAGLDQSSIESRSVNVVVKPLHCFNKTQDSGETCVDGGGDCGGCVGDPCDANTTVNACQPDDGMCGPAYTCNLTSCTCIDGPVIHYVSPATDPTGNTDFDNATTWTDDVPNGAPDNLITIWGRNFGDTAGAQVLGGINFDNQTVDTPPSDWTAFIQDGKSSVLISGDTSRSSGNSLKIKQNDGVTPAVDVTARLELNSSQLTLNNIYRLDFYYRMSSTNPVVVSVGDSAKIIPAQVDQSASGWHHDFIVFTEDLREADAGEFISFKLNAGPTAGSQFYLDDLVLTHLPQRAEVVFLGGAGSSDDRVAPFAFQVNAQCTDSWRDDQIVVAVPAGTDGPIAVTGVDGRTDRTDDGIGPLVPNFDINDQNYPGICSVDPQRGVYPDQVNIFGLGLPTTAPQDVVWHYRTGGASLLATSTQESDWTTTSVRDQIIQNIFGATSIRVYGDGRYSNAWSFTASRGGVGDPCNSQIGQATGQCVATDICESGLFCDPGASCTCQIAPIQCGDGVLADGEACDVVDGQDVFQNNNEGRPKNQCSDYDLGEGLVGCSDTCSITTDQCTTSKPLGAAGQSTYGWGFTAGLVPAGEFYVMEQCDRSNTCRQDDLLASPSPWYEADGVPGGWTPATSPGLNITEPLACVNTMVQTRFSGIVDSATINNQAAIVLKCPNSTGSNCTQVNVPAGNVHTGSTGDGNSFMQLIPATSWDTDSWYKVILTGNIKSNTKQPLVGNPSSPNRIITSGCTDLAFTDLGGASKTITDGVLDGSNISYCWNFKTRPTAAPCTVGCVDCTPDPTLSFWSGESHDQTVTPDSADNVCLSLNARNYNWNWSEKEYSGPALGADDYNPRLDSNWRLPPLFVLGKSWINTFYHEYIATSWAIRETIFDRPDYVRLEAEESVTKKFGYCPAINDFTNPIVVEDQDCRQGNIQSPSPWKGSIDACINATVAVRFSRSMVNSSFTFAGSAESSNVVVEQCGNVGSDGVCTSWNPINDQLIDAGAGLVVFKYRHQITQDELDQLTDDIADTVNTDPDPEGFTITDMPDLDKNTQYRVVIKGGHNGVRGSKWRMNNNGTPTVTADDYQEELDSEGFGILLTPNADFDYDQDGDPDYAWSFKTADSDEKCAVDSVNVSPSRYFMRYIDQVAQYSAFPQAVNCNVLDGQDYDWNWRSLIALADDNNLSEAQVNSCNADDTFNPNNQGSGAPIASLQSLGVNNCRDPFVEVRGRAEGFTNIQARAIATRPAGSANWLEDKSGSGELQVGLGRLAITRHRPAGVSQCTNENVVVNFNNNIKSASVIDNLKLYRCPIIPADATAQQRAELEQCLIAGADEPIDNVEWIYPTTDGTTVMPEFTRTVIASSTWEPGARYRAIVQGGRDGVIGWNDTELSNLNYRLSTGNGEECEPELLPWREVPGSCTNSCRLAGSVGGAVCGNNTIETGEACDDGNTNNGDGCSNICLNEGSSAGPFCGNDQIEIGEDCDDNNTKTGDGCSDRCLWEGQPAASANGSCGNATTDVGEQCDDGNTTPGDGCSDRCLYEGVSLTCGNNTVEAGEACDGGAGCSARCLHTGSTSLPTSGAQCGDGDIEFGESCDDGNITAGDGCSQICLNEGSTGGAVCNPAGDNDVVESGQNDSYSWTFDVAPTADTCDVVDFDDNRCTNGIRQITFDKDVEGVVVKFYRGSDAATNPGNCLDAQADVSFWRAAIERIKSFVRRMIGIQTATAVNFWCPVTDDLTLANNDFSAIDQGVFTRKLGETTNATITDDFEIIGYRLPGGSRQISYVKKDNFDINTQYRFEVIYTQNGVPLTNSNGSTFPPVTSTLTTLGAACALSDVTVNVWPAGEDKRNDNFFCAGDNCGAKTKDVYDDDQSGSQSGNQHIYRAWALGKSSPAAVQSYPIRVASIDWSMPPMGLDKTSDSAVAFSDYDGDRWLTAGDVMGDRQMTINARDGGQPVSTIVNIKTFLCANPWPAPAAFPFRDSGGINTNFETYYCRDQGVEGDFSDDLPPIGNYDPVTKQLGVVTTTATQISVGAIPASYAGPVGDTPATVISIAAGGLPAGTVVQSDDGINRGLLYRFTALTAGNYNLLINTSNQDDSLTRNGYYRTHDVDVFLATTTPVATTNNNLRGQIKPLAVPPSLKQQSVVSLGQLEQGTTYTVLLRWNNDFCANCGATDSTRADSNFAVHSVGSAKTQAGSADYQVLKEILLPYDYTDQSNDAIGANDLTARFTVSVEGKFGQGYYMSGNNSYIDLPITNPSAVTAPQVLPANGGTVSFWFKPAQARTGLVFSASKNDTDPATDSGSDIEIGTVLTGEGRLYFRADAGSAMVSSNQTAPFAADQWYHVALAYNDDSRVLKLYINGALVGSSGEGSGGLADASSPWTQIRLGAGSDDAAAANRFIASFDDIRIYSDDLSQSQIASLTSNQANAEINHSLAAYYPLDNGSPDAVGIRVMTNPQHLAPLSWYQLAFARERQGSPADVIVDSYQAIKEGRTTYIAGTDLNDDWSKAYGTVYAASYNEGANESTLNIYQQLMNNWRLNAGRYSTAVPDGSLTRAGNCSTQLDPRCTTIDGVGRLNLIVTEGGVNKLYVQEGGYWSDRSDTLFGEGSNYLSRSTQLAGAWYFGRAGGLQAGIGRINLAATDALGKYKYHIYNPNSRVWSDNTATMFGQGLKPDNVIPVAGWYITSADRLKVLAKTADNKMQLFEHNFATTGNSWYLAGKSGLPQSGGLLDFINAAGWYYNGAEHIIARTTGNELKYYTRTTSDWQDVTGQYIGGADKLPADIIPISGTVVGSGSGSVIQLFAQQGSDNKRFTYRDGKWTDTTVELESAEFGPNIRNMDIKAAYYSFINFCQTEKPVACLTDNDCQVVNAGVCYSDKAKITRDTERLADVNEIDKNISVYHAVKRCSTDHNKTCTDNTQCFGGGVCGNYYPRLDLGTYIAGRSFSVWPSWQETLGLALGATLPTDPLNQLTGCSDPFDEQTCWSAQNSSMQCPRSNSAVYAYYSYDGGNRYGLVARAEYKTSKLIFDAIQSRVFNSFSAGQMCTVYRSDACGDGDPDDGENCYTCPADITCGNGQYCQESTKTCENIPTGTVGDGDQCPFTDKSAPGPCGCDATASQDADDDGDGTLNCVDQCDDRDQDSDGIINCQDNCTFRPDDDADNICNLAVGDNPADNCVNIYNPDQSDFDGDSVGDLCDDNYVVDGKRLEIFASQGATSYPVHPYATPQTAAEFYDYHSSDSGLSAIFKHGIVTGDGQSAIFSHFDTIRKKLSVGFLHRGANGGVSMSFTEGTAGYWPAIDTVSAVLDTLGAVSPGGISWSLSNTNNLDGALVNIGNTFPSLASWRVVVTPASWLGLGNWFVKNPNTDQNGGHQTLNQSSPVTISYGVAPIAAAVCGDGKREGVEDCDCGNSGFDYIFATGNRLSSGQLWLCQTNNNVVPNQPYRLTKTPVYWCDVPSVIVDNKCGQVKNVDSLYCGDDVVQNASGARYETCESGYGSSDQIDKNPKLYAWNGTILDVSNSSSTNQYQCNSFCQQAGGFCGDGLLQKEVNVKTGAGVADRRNVTAEFCDDGDKDLGDGCTNSCQVEAGWTCTEIPGQRSVCSQFCGDGKIDTGESCDDGNRNNQDGCADSCQIEAGYSCTVSSSGTSVCLTSPNNGICGDRPGENWDNERGCPLQTGLKVSLKWDGEGGKFLSVYQGCGLCGAEGVNATKLGISATNDEIFTIEKMPGSAGNTIASGDTIRLKAEKNGEDIKVGGGDYLHARTGGDSLFEAKIMTDDGSPIKRGSIVHFDLGNGKYLDIEGNKDYNPARIDSGLNRFTLYDATGDDQLSYNITQEVKIAGASEVVPDQPVKAGLIDGFALSLLSVWQLIGASVARIF